MTLSKGHFVAEIDTSDLDDVQVSINMNIPLETCEAYLQTDEVEMANEFHALRMMIHEYINHLYALHNQEVAYAM